MPGAPVAVIAIVVLSFILYINILFPPFLQLCPEAAPLGTVSWGPGTLNTTESVEAPAERTRERSANGDRSNKRPTVGARTAPRLGTKSHVLWGQPSVQVS